MTSARHPSSKVRALRTFQAKDSTSHTLSIKLAAYQQPPKNYNLPPSLISAVGKFAPSMQRIKTHFLPKTLQLKFAGVTFNTGHLDSDITKPGL